MAKQEHFTQKEAKMGKQWLNNVRERLRQLRSRTEGQSIPLIALMIVILIAMVGLSVDVGNTYSEQRQVVRGVNAAAIVGMQEVQSGTDDASIRQRIEDSLLDNGIITVPVTKTDLAPNERRVEAYYLDLNGNRVAACQVGSCGFTPSNVEYVEVFAEGDVETYFARVVGQEELNVEAVAFAGLCPPINGVMPVTMNHNVVDPDGGRDLGQGDGVAAFRAEDRDGVVTMWDLGGERYSWKRVWLEDPETSTAGDLGLLRWRSGYGVSDLEQMLSGEGILKLGFEEVPEWPGTEEDNFEPIDNYPLEPQYLTESDWVYGLKSSGAGGHTFTTSELARLQEHIDNRTRVILPLYGFVTPSNSLNGDPDNPAYFMVQFGEFYILDAGPAYLDLALIDYAPRIPCASQNVVVPENQRFGVIGDVQVRPRWVEEGPDWKPAAFTIMLDVSGSMNLSFEGWGVARGGPNQGKTYQCESRDPLNPQIPYSYEVLPFTTLRCDSSGGDCACGTRPAPWPEQTERRAYAGRHAILNIARQMDVKERMQVVFYSSNVEDVTSRWYAPDGLDGIALEDEILNNADDCPDFASGPGPCYYTSGGTNGAAALKKTSDLIRGSDFPQYNGEDLRRVVIYMTDGVSNRRSDGANVGTKPQCQGMRDNERKNTAFCQIGYGGSKARPVTEMMEISTELHDQMRRDGHDDFQLYYVAMGRVDTTGADEIATSPSQVYKASNSTQLQAFLEDIRAQVNENACIYQRDDLVDWVGDSHKPDPAAWASFGITDDVFGFIDIHKADGAIVHQNVPIINNDNTGKLGFQIPAGAEGLQPGNYQLRNARVIYNPQGGSNGRDELYTQMRMDGQEVTSIPFTVSRDRILGDSYYIPTDWHLDLPMVRIDSLCDDL